MIVEDTAVIVVMIGGGGSIKVAAIITESLLLDVVGCIDGSGQW